MSRRLTALMTADAVGGVWTYALELCRALDARGVDVFLATMGARPSPAQRREVAALSNIELLESDFALEWMDGAGDDVEAAGRWLLDLERALDVDVVHINGFAHAALPFRAPVVAVAHSCVCSWWRAVLGEEAPPRFDDYRRRVAAGLAAADAVVAPTAAILEAIVSCYDVDVTGEVIANGLDQRGLRAGGKEPIVLSAGRFWDAAKNLASLDACAPVVPWPIMVAGPTEHPGKRRAIESRQLRMLGQLPLRELRRLMSRAAIYALPARYEPFGLSALEAALSGCALVLGDIDSLREIWDGAAVFVPPGDPAAIGESITALTRDPSRRRTLSDRARRRAAGYTSARMASAYRVLYDRLAVSEKGACA